MRIVIIGAMSEEIEKLIEHYNMQIDTDTNRKIYLSNINNKQLIVSESGVGKIISASNTQYIIDRYSPACIINIGCAGSLAEGHSLFDTIISTAVNYHDSDLMREVNFKANDELIAKATTCAEDLNINYYLGMITTGDCFVNDSFTKERIIEKTGAIAVDMESASIGHVATINKTPFLIIRSISDFADGKADMDLEAANKPVEIVKKLVKKL